MENLNKKPEISGKIHEKQEISGKTREIPENLLKKTEKFEKKILKKNAEI